MLMSNDLLNRGAGWGASRALVQLCRCMQTLLLHVFFTAYSQVVVGWLEGKHPQRCLPGSVLEWLAIAGVVGLV